MSAVDLLEDPEFLAEFVQEAMENLTELDGLFVELERDPGDRPALAAVFRGIHTIKGTSGFLALPRIERLSHAGEDLLSLLRDGRLLLDVERTTCLLGLMDRLREILAQLESDGAEPPGDDTELLEALRRLATPDEPDGAAAPTASAATAGPTAADPTTMADPTTPAAPDPSPAPVPTPSSAAPEARDRSGRLGDLLVELGLATPYAISRGLDAQRAGDARRLGEILVAEGLLHADQLLQVLDEQLRRSGARTAVGAGGGAVAGLTPAEPDAGSAAGRTREHADASVRVDVGVLDGLVDLVGELVLARNRLLQEGAGAAAPSPAAHEVDRLTSDLQHQVLRTRVQQIRAAWTKVPRIARDVALTLGKQVRVVMEGESTELDRSLVEAVKDPLLHLVRNAVDHGIECPDLRRAAGKDPEGTLRLSARQEGGDVVIEIADDGNGMDPVRIREVAVRRGVLDAEAAAALSDADALELIFEPGFSTAAAVTSISGRGVGMDVVRTSLQTLGGSLEVDSVLGRGSTFTLRIPLTLAIMPALVVGVAGRRYVLPEAAVVQIVRMRTVDGRVPLDRLPDGLCLRWLGRLLPVVDLTAAMDGIPVADRTDRRSHVVVVVQSHGRRLGLLVDAALEIEEVVVKSLARAVNPYEIYSGATILGDGAIAAILDVAGLVRLTGLLGIPAARDGDATAVDEAAERMLVCLAGGRRYGVPAGHVRHVVRIGRDDVHWDTAAGAVVVIGDELHPVATLTPEHAEHDRRLSVVDVAADAGSDGDSGRPDAHVLLLVDAVLDVVPAPPAALGAATTVLHDGVPVDLLDPLTLVATSAA